MKNLLLFFLLALSFCIAKSQELSLQKTKDHPIQYYLSLPQGWSKAKTWPVVVVLEAADKEYQKNAERFVAARGAMPFILVAPINTNNGNQGRRDPKLFPYSNETWNYMEKVGDCQFNDEGIGKIMKEVAILYNGENKIYVTGFEAGAHVLWSLVFNHPEWLNAAASVAGNFRNRCVEPSKISNSPSRKNLLIKSFVGDADDYFGPGGKVYNQWTEVKSLALSHGFENISETVIRGKGHVPMPEEVMNYFNSLLKK
jgi:poly(3-hydroxybutyrate) depolymerase